MNLKDESVYYIKRWLKGNALRSKRNKAWVKQLDKHQCIFVHIPKTAGISVSVSLLGESIGNMSALYYQALFGKDVFGAYFKFAFVRNPYTRLVSAFEFLKNGGGGEQDSDNIKVVMPYDNLADFVLHQLTPASAMANRYFRPQHHFVCNSNGKLMVDFVGRFEQIETDYELIRKRIGSGEPLKQLNITSAGRRSYEPYFANAGVRQKVKQIYAKDFALFEYSEAPEDVWLAPQSIRQLDR